MENVIVILHTLQACGDPTVDIISMSTGSIIESFSYDEYYGFQCYDQDRKYNIEKDTFYQKFGIPLEERLNRPMNDILKEMFKSEYNIMNIYTY